MGCVSCNSPKKTSGWKNSGSCSRCSNFSVFDWLSNIPHPSGEKNRDWIQVSVDNVHKMLSLNKVGNENFFIEDFVDKKLPVVK